MTPASEATLDLRSRRHDPATGREQPGSAPIGSQTPSFAVQGLTKRFPGVLAVDSVDLAVVPGEIRGIIGRNGAGKSVLVNMIAGLVRPSSGEIRVAGAAIDARHYTPAAAHAHGVVLVPQEPAVAGRLSVADNLFMGAVDTGALGLVRLREMRAKAREILELLDIDASPATEVRELALESQQLLAFAKAYYVLGARVILMDEITASLARERKRLLMDLLRQLQRDDPYLSFLLISHHISDVIEVCDSVTVMRDGRAVTTLRVSETSEGELAHWIVGEDPGRTAAPPARGAAPGEVLLSVDGLGARRHFAGLSFELRAGEVLGFAGLDGSGRDEAMETLFGLRRRTEGRVELAGDRIAPRSPREALAAGLAYLPKHRDAEAVIQNQSVEANTLASSYRRTMRAFGLIDGAEARRRVETSIADLDVKTPGPSALIDALSGGNKQKVLIARLIMAEPRVFLLNEPTRGVDIAAKPRLLATVRDRLAENAGVIVIAESEEELIEICDRILVFHKGRVVRSIERGTADFSVTEVYRAIQAVES